MSRAPLLPDCLTVQANEPPPMLSERRRSVRSSDQRFEVHRHLLLRRGRVFVPEQPYDFSDAPNEPMIRSAAIRRPSHSASSVNRQLHSARCATGHTRRTALPAVRAAPADLIVLVSHPSSVGEFARWLAEPKLTEGEKEDGLPSEALGPSVLSNPPSGARW
jgi:hypothetical protein